MAGRLRWLHSKGPSTLRLQSTQPGDRAGLVLATAHARRVVWCDQGQVQPGEAARETRHDNGVHIQLKCGACGTAGKLQRQAPHQGAHFHVLWYCMLATAPDSTFHALESLVGQHIAAGTVD